MENIPTERAPEDERVEDQMPGMHEENVAGVDAPEQAPIPEVPAGVSEAGVATGVDPKIEAKADAFLAANEGEEIPGPSVEGTAPLPGEVPGEQPAEEKIG